MAVTHLNNQSSDTVSTIYEVDGTYAVQILGDIGDATISLEAGGEGASVDADFYANPEDEWVEGEQGNYVFTWKGAIRFRVADAGVGTSVTVRTDKVGALPEKILRNKQVTDPDTGEMTVYDDDNTTVLFTADVFEDVDGDQAYRGQGINRRDRFE